MDLTAREIFDKYQGSASKSLGQNYIFSRDINRRIVSLAGCLDGKNVLEIGPGPGGLTVEILQQNVNSLTLIELDNTWANAWQDIAFNEQKINVIHQDVLKVDIDTLNIDIIISNLPYNVSSQILLKLLPNLEKYQRLVLMFQKEMADRIIAKHDTKDYGRLSILSQFKGNISRGFNLSPNCFSPPPKVHSTVLVFDPKEKNEKIDYGKLNQLVSIAFENRRKQVLKGLSKAYKDVDFASLFDNLHIRQDARAEQITLEQWVEISKFV